MKAAVRKSEIQVPNESLTVTALSTCHFNLSPGVNLGLCAGCLLLICRPTGLNSSVYTTTTTTTTPVVMVTVITITVVTVIIIIITSLKVSNLLLFFPCLYDGLHAHVLCMDVFYGCTGKHMHMSWYCKVR